MSENGSKIETTSQVEAAEESNELEESANGLTITTEGDSEEDAGEIQADGIGKAIKKCVDLHILVIYFILNWREYFQRRQTFS